MSNAKSATTRVEDVQGADVGGAKEAEAAAAAGETAGAAGGEGVTDGVEEGRGDEETTAAVAEERRKEEGTGGARLDAETAGEVWVRLLDLSFVT